MNPLDRISDYLNRLERGLRWLTLSRGAAILGAVALAATLLLAVVLNQLAFSDTAVFWARFGLFVCVALALTAAMVLPMLALNRRRSAKLAERRFPDFGERLLTFAERQSADPRDPFLPLLAEDALDVAQQAEPSAIASPARAAGFASAFVTAGAVLLWLGLAGPGFLGYGTALLWGGAPTLERKPLRSILITPGDATIRRRMDQLVHAKLLGFDSADATLYARYASSSKWEQAPMQRAARDSSFEFLFAGVPEPVEYYVAAAGVRSGTYKLNVSDLPSVKKLRVTYHYPAYYGMKDEVEDPGGDLRAVEGTVAEVQVETDRPLADASILLDSGQGIALAGSPLSARVPMVKDGTYHVSALDHGQQVRISEDYFIEARRDSPPVISIKRPGRDAKVSPIEEVPIAIEAKDDFGLQAVELHYSVNGGPDKVQSVLARKGAKTADGGILLTLEDYKLEPGDIVSLYATAKDAKNTARTDIYFIEARPYEYEYSQSQMSGGSGGQQQDSEKISEREKEIIAATWNQSRDTKDHAAAVDNAKYLSEVQAKLKEAAQTLANRVKARELGSNNPAFQAFVKDMEAAATAMQPAADQLKALRWTDAMPPEQKALQFALRAESTFRQIQVSMLRGGGGGGAQQGAGRDLESLFNLELDLDKNNYETGSQSPQDARQKAVDESLKRLQELAKRQQQLAEREQQSRQSLQQRWEQEMLRREAEELRRQMEQLARGDQSNSQQQQSSQGGQQSSSSSQGGQQGQQQQGQQQAQQNRRNQPGQQGQQSQQRSNAINEGNRQTLEQALKQLTEAERAMSQSASNAGRQQQNDRQGGQQGAETQADARRAAERLREATDALSRMRRQQTGNQLDDLVRQAGELERREQDFARRLREKFGAGVSQSAEQRQQAGQQMGDEKQQLTGEMKSFERDMQQAARDMASTQPGAASKLREAIGSMQQDELEMRMKRSEEYLRRGLGQYSVMQEAPIQQSLSETRQKLEQAQSALDKNSGGNGQDPQLAQALDQAAKLRQKIEQMGRDGQQKGQQKGGQRGGEQPGSEQSSQSGQPSGQQGGEQSAQSGNASTGGRFSDGGESQQYSQEAILRGIEQLRRLTQNDAGVARELRDLQQQAYRGDPRRLQGDPALLAQIEARMLAQIEQVELELRRKAESEQGAAVRVLSPRRAPAGYDAAAAEYYRRLSREKP